jgi:hypothetical protein
MDDQGNAYAAWQHFYGCAGGVITGDDAITGAIAFALPGQGAGCWLNPPRGYTAKGPLIARGGVCPEAIPCFEQDRDCFVAHCAPRSDGVADSFALYSRRVTVCQPAVMGL